MKSKEIVGIIMFMVAFIWGATIAWTNPDMTTRRLWLEFPLQLALCLGLAIGGSFLFIYSQQED